MTDHVPFVLVPLYRDRLPTGSGGPKTGERAHGALNTGSHDLVKGAAAADVACTMSLAALTATWSSITMLIRLSPGHHRR